MRFVAKNFEADVTNVTGAEWVIAAQGHRSRSVRAVDRVLEQEDCRWVTEFQSLTEIGWVELMMRPRGRIEGGLADAIALLYSVPGVRLKEETQR